MAILALDLATVTGWAFYRPGRPVAHGCKHLPTCGPNVGLFLDQFEIWLADRLTTLQPGVCVFESPVLPSKTTLVTLRKLYGLAGLAEMICRRREVDCYEANIGAVRKHFIGHGRPPKDQAKALVIEACRARGWAPQDHNAADALAILDYSAHLQNLPIDYPKTALEGPTE